MIRPMVWQSGTLRMLDQRALPAEERWLDLRSVDEVVQAIRDMAVRGAPAIGIAAAYGMAIAARLGDDLAEAKRKLAASRPTAVNLFWALDRVTALRDLSARAIEAEASKIESEDLAMNLAIGSNGAALIPMGANVLTICNTGALATAGHGTALGVIRSAHQLGRDLHVWSCETRPRQQGLRLTAYELEKEGIPFHSIADGAAGSLMAAGKVNCVLAGADRIAANGDTANKIGTYSLAVLAEYHEVPFYVAAPSSTLDASIPTGDRIVIEERPAEELTHIDGVAIAPIGCRVYNPAFDVTPARLISAIITENGVFRFPYSFGRS